ncbi:MAG: FKBP-type peptidyl-prolyl cis-trans isomerase, partial [Candidatus Methanomethylophilaceae archaeon]|nr:FKBP-type peptidyl-prolyl cis-trans isomerase [Candidatus Methanomethylophilaceae archaeon]
MAGDEQVKKKRDPIFTICLVLFAIAAIAVIGVYIEQHFLEKDNTAVAFGDTVEVDFAGSFYDYYDQEKAVLFDTNIEKVDKDSSIAKSNTYTEKTSYNALSFNTDTGSVIQGFKDAVIGHKVGDWVRVKIPNGEGYVGADTTTTVSSVKVPVYQTMSSTEFKNLYGFTPASDSGVKTVYGWDGVASVDSSTKIVTVHNMPTSGSKYVFNDTDSEDSRVKITTNVTSVDANEITVTFSFENAVYVSG